MKQFLIQFAQKVDANAAGIPQMTGDELLHNGLNLMYFLAGIVAIITMIIGGLMYIISNGDAARITKGKNLVTYSIVGLIIVLSAFAVTNFVIWRFN